MWRGSGRFFLKINHFTLFMMKKSEMYISPEIEVIELLAEGVLCLSGEAEDSDDVELF